MYTLMINPISTIRMALLVWGKRKKLPLQKHRACTWVISGIRVIRNRSSRRLKGSRQRIRLKDNPHRSPNLNNKTSHGNNRSSQQASRLHHNQANGVRRLNTRQQHR
jgi:hypothetical protein